ncbi:MAG: DNA polymerase I [Bacteroidales bacterium]|nr:DNA polymerase I [Bacteroidales bacterium]MCF8336928.1 DNA polymerase I [Bacteroidales bacterium]
MSKDNKRLFLLDAMALIYRAYFALSRNPRINSKGMNTSAILGFTNTLYDVLKNEKPTYIGVAFDSFAPTLRHEDFTDYKANREELPEDIAQSLPYIKEIIKGFNIPIIAMEGYEADDIIGTMAKEAEEQGFTTYMMTSDKDFGQLVSENIFLYKPSYKGSGVDVLGKNEVCEKYGVRYPEQIVDLLGLWGDTSDNIPGVPGIGQKTASKLLQHFDTVEELIQNPEKIDKESIRKKIRENTEQARMSRQLAKIITDAPVEFEPEKLKISAPEIKKLKELFDELEFRAFARRFFSDMNQGEHQQPDLFSDVSGEQVENAEKQDTYKTLENTDHQYFLADDKEKRQKLIDELSNAGEFCYDTETTGLDVHREEMIGMSFSTQPGRATYVPLPEDRNQCREILHEFKPVFTNDKILKIGQNLKFDNSILKWYDIEVAGPFFDTMLAHYLIEPEQRHNMDDLAQTYLNYRPVPYESLAGKKGKNQKTLKQVDPQKLKDYAAEDADITLQLKQALEPRLEENNVINLFKEIEIPLIEVLADMEAAGVKLDKDAVKEISEKLASDLQNLEEKIYEQAGEKFNIASTQQLGKILFEKLKVTEKPKLTKTKQYSTSEDYLRKLKDKHPIIGDILEWRQVAKLKNTYVDTLPDLINPKTGRIHTSFNQTVTATGRLSSTNPNLQNIPIRTERGREIRKAFVARDENHLLLAADYSQIELRIMAELSGDKNLLDAFRKGQDIHAATASRIYGVPLEEVTKEMRRKAKTANFGIIYGISAFGLSERLEIPRKEAAEIINTYFEQYPSVKNYMDNNIEFAREHGYVETIMKRRRYLKDIYSNNSVVRGVAERNAINAPIQGSSADMIKIAMINIFEALKKEDLKTRMILQVHDELVFDVHKDELDKIKKIAEDKMKNAIELNVPIIVEMDTGCNWLEAH